MARKNRVSPLGLTLGAGVAAAVVWGTLIERQLFTLRRHTLPILNPGHRPVRVLHLSDLHLAPWQKRKQDWLRSLANLKPDLVVLTGDLLGHRDALPSLAEALSPLARSGAKGVFVYGSNDYYGPILKNPLKYLQEPTRRSTRARDLDTAALTHLLEEDFGFTSLNNAAADLAVGGSSFRLFGLNDPHIRFDDPAQLAESAASLSEEVGQPVRLGVVHAPYREALDVLLGYDTSLLLAGHTHGGQVRAPLVGALTTNCDLPLDQGRGLSVWFDDERSAFLNVSAGLGNSIYAPVRFLCRPEASLITLEAPERH